MKQLVITTCLLLLGLMMAAQDTAENSKWMITGYVKNLATGTFMKDDGNTYLIDLIHNRINIRWQPDSQLTAAFELRNRMYFGDHLNHNVENSSENIGVSIIFS